MLPDICDTKGSDRANSQNTGSPRAARAYDLALDSRVIHVSTPLARS